MTQPQQDPAADVGAALARLAEQTLALQRQINRMEVVFTEQVHAALAVQRESEARITALTDAKFVTYRTLIDSQADKVKLALEATEKAIGKAEVATSKAIEKESESNNDRFAKVNEFRAQQTELIARFATLERVDLLYAQSRQRLEEINANLQARIGELVEWRNRTEGVGQGAKDNKNGIYAAIAAVGVLLTIIVVVANLLATR